MGIDYQYLTYEKTDRIGWITLNRPERLNAQHYEAVCELDSVTKLIERDDEVKLVAVTGAGPAFCTGMDLKALSAGEIGMRYCAPWEEALRRFEQMEKIVLCRMHKYALGGGLQLALACDIRACTPSTRVALPAVKEGLIAGMGTQRLAWFIGLGRAKRMILSGDEIDGEEALRIGLVDHLISDESYEADFEALIEKYEQVNSEPCRLSKLAVQNAFEAGFDDYYASYLPLQDRAMNSPDYEEATAAYSEGREPDWR